MASTRRVLIYIAMRRNTTAVLALALISACGGDDGTTLFVLTCAGSHPDQTAGTATGALWTTTVDVPRDPLSLP